MPETKALKSDFRYTPPAHDSAEIPLTFGTLIRGYASTWDLDSVDDEIVTGCFTESIEEYFIEHTRKYGAPYIKILYNHEELSGILHYIEENENGLYVEFWCLNTECGRDFYIAIASGAVNQMSIGFIPTATRDKTDSKGRVLTTPSGEKIRQILKCLLLEASGVLWPANYATSVGKSLVACTHEKSADTESIIQNNSEEEKTMEIGETCKTLVQACTSKMLDGGKSSRKEFKAMYLAAEMLRMACWNCEVEDEDPEAVEEMKKLQKSLQPGFVPVAQPAPPAEQESSTTTVESKTKPNPAFGELKNMLADGLQKITVGGKE